MKEALIGYTGFVGSNILSQHQFNYLYDQNNIEDIVNKKFDLVVCSAAPGIKWYANQNPQEDLRSIKMLIENIEKVYSKIFVLISTIDVYPIVNKVNEDTDIDKNKLRPYGKHRRILEEFISNNFNSLIIRLPGVFGKGLKGNIIYDLIKRKYKYIPRQGTMQFYNLDNIWSDISIALENNLTILNISTEPITINELLVKIFKTSSKENGLLKNVPYYNMHSKYGYLWGKKGPYIYSKYEILFDIRKFVSEIVDNY